MEEEPAGRGSVARHGAPGSHGSAATAAMRKRAALVLEGDASATTSLMSACWEPHMSVAALSAANACHNSRAGGGSARTSVEAGFNPAAGSIDADNCVSFSSLTFNSRTGLTCLAAKRSAGRDAATVCAAAQDAAPAAKSTSSTFAGIAAHKGHVSALLSKEVHTRRCGVADEHPRGDVSAAGWCVAR